MAIIVQKFGGTSVGSLECIEAVARKVMAAHQKEQHVVVVVSAIGGETDRLITLAKSLHPEPPSRELDMLLATGEQSSMALLCIALLKLGCLARSYAGWQVPIQTDSIHGKARIVNVIPENILQDLAQGYVVVVAGFQGVDRQGQITTLGRGGSDTTAVALAAALKAIECQIYTDVEGVYTTDPRIVAHARLMPRVTFEEMLELASLGAKVLQIRAVELAGRHNVPLRVLSAFKDGSGTLITYEDKTMEQPVVSGIAFNRDEAKIVILGVPDMPGIAAIILGAVAKAHIEVDMIVQNIARVTNTDLTFTLHRCDFSEALRVATEAAMGVGAKEIWGDDRIAKLSLVGVGMRSHAGIASHMFRVLGDEGINIQLIATSEIKVSVVIDEKHLEAGVRVLHHAFQLGVEPQREGKDDPLLKEAITC